MTHFITSMFNVQKQYPLIEERHLYPNLTQFAKFDEIRPAIMQQQNFTMLPPSCHIQYFQQTVRTKANRFTTQLFAYNPVSIQQFERVRFLEYQNENILYAREIEGRLLAVTHQKPGFTITDFIFNDSRQQLQIDTKDHIIHVLSDDYFVHYSPTTLLQLGTIKKKFLKLQIKFELTQYLNNSLGPVVAMYGYNNYLTVVQQCSVTVMSLYQFQEGQLKLLSQLTSAFFTVFDQSHSFTFNAVSNPILVINRKNQFLVVNFMRRETLEFTVGDPQQRVQEYKYSNQFDQYMLTQRNQFYTFIAHGVGVVSQFDWLANKQRVVTFSCSTNYPTKVFYSSVQEELSYCTREVSDLFQAGQLFMMASAPNLTVKTAIKHVMQQIAALMSQQLNKQLAYQHIQRKRPIQLADLLPYDFLCLLRGEKSQNTDQFQLGPDRINQETLIQAFWRYADRFTSGDLKQTIRDPDQAQIVEQKPLNEVIIETLDACRALNPVRERANSKRDFDIGLDDGDEALDVRMVSSSNRPKRKSLDVEIIDIPAEIRERLKEVACPAYFSEELIIETQGRFQQIPQPLVNSVRRVCAFDFLNQQIVIFDLNLEINDFDGFENILLESHKKKTDSRDSEDPLELQKLRAACLYRSLQADITMNSLWGSGILSQSFELLTSFSSQWNTYVNSLLMGDILDTQLIGQLLTSKTIVDVYFQIANMQIPGSKAVVCHILNAILQLTDQKQAHLIQIDKQLQEIRAAQIDGGDLTVSSLFRLASVHSWVDMSENDVDQTQQSKPLSSYYLVGNDGKTTQYGSMPMIFNLGIFDSDQTQTFTNLVAHISTLPKLPLYCQRNQAVIKTGNEIGFGIQLQRMRYQYNGCRALFLNMTMRSLYHKNMLTAEHSPILQTIFSIMDEYRLILIPRKDVDPSQFSELNRIICQVAAKQFLINADFLCQKMLEKAIKYNLNFDDMVALLEVIELCGCYIEKNGKEMLRKHIIDEQVEQELLDQLYSFGIVDFKDVYLM